jgi:hypothetical protein
VRRFDPGQSLSFARELFSTFALSYADTSLLTGYVGRDIVQLGHYYAMTRFGCALDCNDVHFNGIDGILGLGMPDAALQSIPTPLIFALANDRGGLEGQNYVNERAMHLRKFAILSTAESGELQLGGYDRASTNADMVYVPTTSTTGAKPETRNPKTNLFDAYHRHLRLNLNPKPESLNDGYADAQKLMRASGIL